MLFSSLFLINCTVFSVITLSEKLVRKETIKVLARSSGLPFTGIFPIVSLV